MERSDVVSRVAANARMRCQTATGRLPELADPLVKRICASMGIIIQHAPSAGVMLGGAYARLQIWDARNLQAGGMVWVSQELAHDQAAFAIAHELGHYLLHPGEGITVHRACDQSEVNEHADPAELRSEGRRVEEYTPRARRELEANTFAAELLAPRAQVRALFTREESISLAQLAEHFGISEVLARRRLVDALLAPWNPTNAEPIPAEQPRDTSSMALPDDTQRAAARASGPALVVAGPGTGKTATLIERVAHLVARRGVPPEHVLALTFSNRAAGEMRERLEASGLPGERMPVMTIHAFAATLLREYAPHVPHGPGEQQLAPDFRILDEADALLLMEELLADLPLRYYRSLRNPTARLRTLLADFSRARDGLHTPQRYLDLVNAMPLAHEPDNDIPERAIPRPGKKVKSGGATAPGAYTAEDIERARERACSYAVWDAALRSRGLVDFGGLIQRAVELLREDGAVLADVRGRYPEILVDEFQDTNAAAAELLMLLSGPSGDGLWVVGDRNQSIYRWRGASPANTHRLAERYPALAVHTLRHCYRSVPDIVATSSAMAARMAQLGPSIAPPGTLSSGALRAALAPVALEPVRAHGDRPAVLRCEAFTDDAHERLGLAEAIRRMHAEGVAYRDQAVLRRTHKQVESIAQTLATRGIPVSQTGGFFERVEIKDALALLALSVGPDARGLLRAGPLVTALGFPAPRRKELAHAIHGLKAKGRPLPGALASETLLAGIPELSPETRSGLRVLGDTALSLRRGSAVAPRLLEFLLRPRGYVWQLALQASGPEGLDRYGTDAREAARARMSLAALGELVRLAQRFDTRWAREDDFRKRLTRAVFRVQRQRAHDGRTGSAPIQPDTMESDPAADVLPMADDGAGSHAPTVVEAPTPPVRCFLHYLDALRAAGVEIPISACDEDAVQVLTLHASKGLEYPVVYLPGLAYGQFPTNGGKREDPSPLGFREDNAPGEKEAEERCLFYVGVTRARDTVVLTRAAHYGARGDAQPSHLLGLLDSAPPYLQARPLFADSELAALQAQSETQATQQQDGDVEEDSEDQPDGEVLPILLAERAHHKPVFPLNALEQYLHCPRQYKYASVYNLLDPAEDAVYRFHRYVRRGRSELARIRAEQPSASWSDASGRLADLWTEVGPAGHAYDTFYWQSADSILRDEWRALHDPAAADETGAPTAEPLQADLRSCVVEVRPDRMAAPSAGGAAGVTVSPVVLVRQHIGRERSGDKDDLALPLYYIAHEQQHPDVPVRIELAYLSNVLADTTDTSDAAFQRKVCDVTGDARKTAEAYLNVDRKRASRLDKLDRAALGIMQARFPPKPSDEKCAACPYRYVCPADPEEE